MAICHTQQEKTYFTKGWNFCRGENRGGAGLDVYLLISEYITGVAHAHAVGVNAPVFHFG